MQHKIVSRGEWLEARTALLTKEKAFTPEAVAAGSALYNFRLANPGVEDLSGDSVFFKDDTGQIFHTYSVFGRGGEDFLGTYRCLDVMPRGRNENGPYHSLGDWVRPRTRVHHGEQ